jgi:acetate kinase
VAGLRVLVVNAGSSSLKLAVVEGGSELALERQHPALEGKALATALDEALADAGELDAAGHRVVHGGERFRSPARITEDMMGELLAETDLAPLHNPPALKAIEALGGLRPELPAVACFDTGFHSTLPPRAATYALPASWTERWSLRRYGFQGLSHSWVARRVPELLGEPVPRIVSCHLGAGASLAAIAGGRSVETTMGFTPLEGLVMATRSGSIDPGLLLWVQRHGGIDPAAAERALNHDAGLLGMTRSSGDMREVIAAADAGDDQAALALEVYVHRLRAGIASMAAAMDGLDAIAFTAGVGENSARLRAEAAADLGFLGVALDETANEGAGGDAVISAEGARVQALVVRAREDLQIAREVEAALEGESQTG